MNPEINRGKGERVSPNWNPMPGTWHGAGCTVSPKYWMLLGAENSMSQNLSPHLSSFWAIIGQHYDICDGFVLHSSYEPIQELGSLLRLASGLGDVPFALRGFAASVRRDLRRMQSLALRPPPSWRNGDLKHLLLPLGKASDMQSRR
jgi:hypothetical protein